MSVGLQSVRPWARGLGYCCTEVEVLFTNA
jgi:hypothetical protein